jgi:transposase InsO family protein
MINLPFRPTGVPEFYPRTDGLASRRSKKSDALTLLQDQTSQVRTMYKRKADKIRPLDEALEDGSTPEGDPLWREHALAIQRKSIQGMQPGPVDHLFEPRYSKQPRGFRITEARWLEMRVDPGLRPNEKELLRQMLLNREPALAWDFTEIGRCHDSVIPPVEVKTQEHKAWQARSFPVPKALDREVIEMLQERMDANTLERGHGPYRNAWFLVKKKTGGHRLINSATEMNSVTIRDAMLPPNADEFAEDLAGRPMSTLLDFLSGYDQITLHKNSRDMTAIQTPLGLLRQTTLLQGATNSVAQFVRAVMHILHRHLNDRARPYLDDIVVKCERTTDPNREALPGVRIHVLEHLKWMDSVLADIERSGCTVSGKKSEFCSTALEIVGYLCTEEGRKPTDQHLDAILKWKPCKSVTEVRGFLGVCTYYRIWISDYSEKAAPLFALLKKSTDFYWDSEHDEAMNELKTALTSAPALLPLQYGNDAGPVILAVDSCQTGYGGCLMQEDSQKRRHPCRYESGLWSIGEQKYDIVKLECRSLLHMLKKFRPWLYGIRFTVETDANTLVAQLNRAATDLPGALVTRWIAWIKLWDFDIKHVPGKKNIVADALSRQTGFSTVEEDTTLDEFVDNELSCIRIKPIRVQAIETVRHRVLDETYTDEHEEYAHWLTTLHRPEHLDTKAFLAFKVRALQYVVRGGCLYKRQSKNIPLRRVIDSPAEQLEVITSLHDDSGHRGREGTYRRVADRFFWKNCYQDVRKFVQSCEVCQKRAHGRLDEALRPTWSAFMGDKWALDVVYMPSADGKNFLVLAREDVSGWVEGKAIANNDSASIAKFIWEDIICRHGLPLQIIMDNGPENSKLTEVLLQKYGVKRIVISSYHPQANGMIERGHQPIVNALSKHQSTHGVPWPRGLHGMMWADRTTVKTTTGKTPAALKYGAEHILPIDMVYSSWGTLDWSKVHTTEDLLVVRCRQLERRDEDLEEIVLRTRRLRESNKDVFDEAHNIRSEELKKGDLVLLWDVKKERDKSTAVKLQPRWLGPYRIIAVTEGFGSYRIAELDGSFPTKLTNRRSPYLKDSSISLPYLPTLQIFLLHTKRTSKCSLRENLTQSRYNSRTSAPSRFSDPRVRKSF